MRSRTLDSILANWDCKSIKGIILTLDLQKWLLKKAQAVIVTAKNTRKETAHD